MAVKAKVEIPREMEADQGIAQNNGASTDVWLVILLSNNLMSWMTKAEILGSKIQNLKIKIVNLIFHL
jgi:hypothetical protein